MDQTRMGKLTWAILHGQNELIESLLEKDDTLVDNLNHQSRDLRPALHSAVYLGDVNIVKKLLDAGASPNVFSKINETALMLAAKLGKFAIVDILLSNDKLANWMNEEHFAHFHIACMRNRVDVVKKFAAKGEVGHTDINLTVKSESLRWAGYTPLHFAVEFQSVETIDCLLSLGADITIKNANQLTPLHLADTMRNEKIIDMMLESHKRVTQNPANQEGLSHFHIACTRNNPGIVGSFIKNGVVLDEKVKETSLNWSKYTAIDFAIYYDCIDNVRLLLIEGGRDKFPSNGAINRVANARSSGNVDLVNLILHRDKFVRDVTTPIKKLPTLHSMCIRSTLDDIKNLSAEALSELNQPMWQGSTPLHLAIERGDEAIIKHLLDLGADYGIKNADGRPSLHLAFIRNMKTTVKLILSYLKNVVGNSVDDDGLSHLHIACALDESKAVENLIGKGADVNLPVNFKSTLLPGFTPLHFAAKFWSTQVIPILLERGASYSVFNKNGTSAFDIAVHEQGAGFSDETNFKMMKEMLSHSSEPFNDRGFSLLHLLAGEESDQTEVTREFIRDNPNDLNKAVHKLGTPWDGYTPLHFAMKTGHPNNARLLVEMGADTFSKASNGDTPFHLILRDSAYGNRVFSLPDIPQNLLDFEKTQHNPVGINGYSLFHVACATGNVEWAKFFLRHGVDPNLRAKIQSYDSCAETPLHMTLLVGGGTKHEIVKLLLENGADVSAKDENWLTPLHYMLYNSDPKLIDLLMSHGANVNSRNVYLDSPLCIMCLNTCYLGDNDLKKMVSALLDHGADVNLTNERGLIPLSFMLFREPHAFPSTTESIMQHILKLRAVGLFVSRYNREAFLKLITSCPDGVRLNVAKFSIKVLKEQELLASVQLNSFTTLRGILLKNLNEMSVWSENSKFQQIVDAGDFQVKFPIYGPMIKLQWKRGKDRRSLLVKSQRVLHLFLKNSLPRECLELILQLLSNKDLENLVISGSQCHLNMTQDSRSPS